MTILETKAVTRPFGDLVAVDGLTIRIDAGYVDTWLESAESYRDVTRTRRTAQRVG